MTTAQPTVSSSTHHGMNSGGNPGSNCLSNQTRYHALVEFAYKHLDFQMSELESVLAMHGISLLRDEHDTSENDAKNACRIEQLPNHERFLEEKQKNHNMESAKRPFLILSLPYHSQFVPKSTQTSKETSLGDIASILLSRCTLVRSVIELWGMGCTIEDCAASVKNTLHHHPSAHNHEAAAINKSWKLTVHTLGSKHTREEQEAMRLQFSFMDLKGPVQMKQPDNEFVLIREIELDGNGGVLYPRQDHLGQAIPENDARLPLAAYFGRILGGERPSQGRKELEQYSLKKRTYLGPTSMDAELSFIMTNLGLVRQGSLVFDPFVGTGSILVSCALRGAFCVGTDIDIRVLRGRSQHENVWSNFQQFNLPMPELIRSDNAIYHRHFRYSQPIYDAILCDPPYGIRAGARKSGSRLEQPRPVQEEFREDHIAQTRYTIGLL